MKPTGPLKFKVATEEWEIELIHRLNYQTFVEEIPQHETNLDGRLVDKFHAENTYLICLVGRELAGMMAFRGQRPFSLDQKLPHLDSYLPPGRSICELRLLAIDRKHRNSAVLPGLLSFMEKYGTNRGYDTAVISGTTRQLKLYQRIGFKPFGPLVGTPGAQFQPMVLFLEEFKAHAEPILNACLQPSPPARAFNFLPGPVAIHAAVRRAFLRPPLSHRSNTFKADFQRVQKMLCELTGASRVEIMLGSGTLANEGVAAQLSLLNQHGLLLSNGEFGERLIDHATRWGLSFEAIKADWGAPLPLEAIRVLLNTGKFGWLWAVHCETSTGVLNDVAALQQYCSGPRVKLCLDGISAIGNMPLDLSGAYLASGVSGKGLAAYPGLALVFTDHELEPAPDKLPRYLDLGFYSRQEGIPFTHSSNLLAALKTAVERVQHKAPCARKRKLTGWLRGELRRRGFHLLTPEDHAAPGVVTLVLPDTQFAQQVGAELEAAGYLISYRSRYLRDRNWMQICLMGECRQKDLVKLMDYLVELCPPENIAAVNQRLRSQIFPAVVPSALEAG